MQSQVHYLGHRLFGVGELLPRDSLNWTSEAEEHFDALKIPITCAPALGLPDYFRPFHLHAGEAVGVAMVDPRAW